MYNGNTFKSVTLGIRERTLPLPESQLSVKLKSFEFCHCFICPSKYVFRDIETNYGLVIETKLQGEKISTNNKRVGEGGQRGKTILIT